MRSTNLVYAAAAYRTLIQPLFLVVESEIVDIVRSHPGPVTNQLMSSQSNPPPSVALSEPSEKILCEPLVFALMLSSLRRHFPRVHYTFPNFATFCRGEPLDGEGLVELQHELEKLQQCVKNLNREDIFDLAPGQDPGDPEIYRQAHYRGRTFDRTRVQVVQENADDDRIAIYAQLLLTIQSEAQKAFMNQGRLVQAQRAYHRPLGPTGFDQV